MAGGSAARDGIDPPVRVPSGRFLLRIVRIGIFLVLATPLVVTTDVVFPFIVGKAVYARSIIEITFAFWVALALHDRRRRPGWSWTMFALAVSLLVSWIAGALGVSPTRSMWSTYERMQGVFDLAHWFAFTLMAGSAFRSAADWRRLFAVNLTCSAAVCATGLAQHYGIVAGGLFDDPSNRMSSTLGNPTYLGAYAMVNVLIGVALSVRSLGPPAGRVGRHHRFRAAGDLWALVALVNLWALWLSGARGAIVGLGVAALVFAAYGTWGRVPTARRAAGVVFVVVVAAAAAFTLARTPMLKPVVESSVMLNRMASLGAGDASVESRVVHIKAGLQAFLDRSVIGWGPENFLVAWGRHADVRGAIPDYAHSKPVEELATRGLLGLASHLALWAVMLNVVLRSLKRLSGCAQLHLYVIGAALAAYFVQSLFLFDTSTTMMQFALLAAFVVSVEARYADSRPPAYLRAPLDRAAGLLKAPIGVSVTTALVAALTIASLVLFNARSYSAASAVADARDKSRPWPARLADFTRAIDEFPPLANQARLFLVVETLAASSDMSADQLRHAVEIIAREAERGLAEEPENWRFEALLAAFYQIVSTRDPAYLNAARRHIDRAVVLAPGVPAVVDVVTEQERIEAGATADPQSRGSS